ncbi:MAG: arsenosugar biosynthesis radical SAM protein ArsS [Deltaproteobacteria bacterium]|nr:arsenosugar biosynthesis radical SAM protein ArsS [Deltaproteobacteria bacterium]
MFAVRVARAVRKGGGVVQSFAERIHANGNGFHKRKIDVLQVNMGKYCNQACLHCHVEAGPGRKEMMTRETVEAILSFLERSEIPTVDVTGGAPELNPNFDYLVESCVCLKRHVMDRCNLTVVFEPGKEYLPEFFKRNRVEVIASLPCYTKENVDGQRGDGTFTKSVQALRILNGVGYGDPDTGLELHLVYNPLGAYLPPPQDRLEREYQRILREKFGIVFNRLYCLANMPITRFEKFLKLRGQYDEYVHLLEDNFNGATLDAVMCRSLLSVDWQGSVYDCDFNQVLDLPLTDREGKPLKIWDLQQGEADARPIVVGDHCYGCTAGAGSSCGGALLS